MTRKIPTNRVDKSEYKNYFKKSCEFYETMDLAMSSRKWNAAALNAIHAGISANDAVLIFVHSLRCTSPKHDDAVKLLKSLMKEEKAQVASKHLAKLINSKNINEYESRLFTQGEAYALVKCISRFMDWVKSILPEQ
jgi:hypothetical protein